MTTPTIEPSGPAERPSPPQASELAGPATQVGDGADRVSSLSDAVGRSGGSAPEELSAPADGDGRVASGVAARTGSQTAARVWSWAHGRAAAYWNGLSVGGMAVALVFFCFSMTPSLLPRDWYLQGVASGICTAVGYAIGTTISWLMRKLGFRFLERPERRGRATRFLFWCAAVLVPLFGILGAVWQHRVRVLVGADLGDPYFYALVVVIALVLARVLLAIVRLLRRLVVAIGRFGGRWIPLPVAKLIAVLITAAFVVTLLGNILLPLAAKIANASFAVTDHGTAEGISQPSDANRSGSAASLAAWDTLGREGRTFVASGPTQAELSGFSGHPAMDPIRVYAGLASANGLTSEAALVVAELQRTGAFDRSVLVVATTTGRGWVNEVAAGTVEYLWNGDTAIAAMQYSYLPSPVAFIADRPTPPSAGRILFDAVHAAWQARPANHRPRLISMGESLGAYGSQGAFDDIDQITAESQGAVWSGTPNFTELWGKATASRDPGSPQQVPVLRGCATVCYQAQGGDIPVGAHPKVVFLQHTNDPVVWWSPNLILHRPDWLHETPQPGRTGSMVWIPLVTFWQVTMDMIFSSEMPDGFGHHYGAEFASAFAAAVPPPGWTAGDTDRLKQRLDGMSTGG